MGIRPMSFADKEKWDRKYGSLEHVPGSVPCEWLTANADLLTGKGKALDIAMGAGGNAVYLAALGYDVLGVDISETGIEKALALAQDYNVKINTLVADMDHYAIAENEYDLILCVDFLDRRLFPAIGEGLRPGGLLFYETFSIDHLKYHNFKKEWVLGHNELLREFGQLRTLRYREVDHEQKAFASLVAEKPDN